MLMAVLNIDIENHLFLSSFGINTESLGLSISDTGYIMWNQNK